MEPGLRREDEEFGRKRAFGHGLPKVPVEWSSLPVRGVVEAEVVTLCDSRWSDSLVVSSFVLTGVGMSRAGPSTLISTALLGSASEGLSHSSFGGVSCRNGASTVAHGP